MDPILPYHAYLLLLGLHIVHPLPLSGCKEFSDGTIQKLQQTIVILEDGSNTISLCNINPQDQTEEEVI